MALGNDTIITSPVLIYYVVASAVAYFRRRASTTDSVATSEPQRPLLRKALLGVIITTTLVSVVEACWQGVAIDGLGKQVKDKLFADLLFVVTWIILFLGLLHSKREAQYPHIGAWIFSLIRCGIIFPRRYTALGHSGSSKTVIALLFSAETAMILLTVFIGVLPKCLRIATERDDSPETQPLLGNRTETVKSSDDDKKDGKGREEREDEQARKEIRDRPLRKYFTSFGIFLPYMLPSTTKQRLVFAGMCLSSAAQRIVNIVKPLSLGLLIDGLGVGTMPWKPLMVYVFLSLLSSSAGLSLLESVLYLQLSQEQILLLNRAAYSHIMNLSANFQDSKSSASVWQSLWQANSVASLFHNVVFEVTPSVVDLVAGFIVLSSVFGGYMGLLLTTTIVSFLWLTVIALPPKAELQREHRDAHIAQFRQLVESSSNWHTVTQFGQIPREKEEFRSKGQATQDAYLRSAFYGYRNRSIRVLVHMGAFFLACGLAVTEISHGEQKIGAFVVLTSYWAQLSQPLYAIVEEINQTLTKLVDAERLLVLLEKEIVIRNAPDAVEYEYRGGAVEFENVHFSYDGKRNAAEGTTFRTPAGSTTAIVGETGGGKTSLLKLLFRFYDPEKGRILIDGQDLKGLKLESFRKHIGVVPQDPALFNTTILDNIRYPDLSLSEEDVEAACKAAALHEKIMTFSKGYQEKPGERGCRLSGGELQRVAIARAILKRPDILLLDEATSAVDSSTETHIQNSLDDLCKGKTTFVIAHRLSTILKADQILVIDAGKLVEAGTHSELLEKRGAYHKLWSAQLKLQSEADKEVQAIAEKEALTLLNDLRETEEEAIELVKVTSGADVDKRPSSAAEEEVKQANGEDEQSEETPNVERSRGRHTVRDRVKLINGRLSSSSRSPQGQEKDDDMDSRNRSRNQSSLNGSAREFVPRNTSKGRSGFVPEFGANGTMRSKKNDKLGTDKGVTRRAKSEPAAREDGETDADDTAEDENDSARYSRIPKRSR